MTIHQEMRREDQRVSTALALFIVALLISTFLGACVGAQRDVPIDDGFPNWGEGEILLHQGGGGG